MSEQTRILDFLALAERLKTELRHSWLSSGRQDSVADDPGARSGRGDVPFLDDSGRAQKPARERAAIESIRRHLGPPLGEEFHDLWHEFERNSSAEARLASALDHLEVQIQHNLAAFESWTPAEYDLARISHSQ